MILEYAENRVVSLSLAFGVGLNVLNMETAKVYGNLYIVMKHF